MKKILNSPFFFISGLILSFFIFYFTRINSFELNNTLKDWSSEQAIFGLMAQDFIKGDSSSFFYFRQSFFGPLTSLFVTKIQGLFNLLNIIQEVPGLVKTPFIISPMAIIMGCFLQIYLGILFYALAIKRIFNSWTAILVSLVLCLGGELLMYGSLRPSGIEMIFFLAGALTYFAVRYSQTRRPSDSFLLGLGLGLGFWMSFEIIFVAIPILFYLISNSNEYQSMRRNFLIKERLSLKAYPVSKGLKIPLLILNGILVSMFFLGLIVSLFDSQILNASQFLMISIFGLIFIHLFLDLYFKKIKLLQLKNLFKQNRFFLIGFFCTIAPPILAKLTGFYESANGDSLKLVPVKYFYSYWKQLLLDFFPRLFLTNPFLTNPWETTAIIVFLGLILIALILVIKKQSRIICSYISLKEGIYPAHSMIFGTLFFNLLFIFFIDTARDQYSLKYGLFLIPILVLFIVTLPRFLDFKGPFLKILSIILLITMGRFSYTQGQEEMGHIHSRNNVSDNIAYLANSECDIYLSSYEQAFKFQYLLQGKKEFIVKDGLDYTPHRTAFLLKTEKKKCILFENLAFQPL